MNNNNLNKKYIIKTMNINRFLFYLYVNCYFVSGSIIYPTPRWIKICNSSSIASWYTNKTKKLKNYLIENKEALYL